MLTLARFIRGLLFIPIILFVSPALILLAVIILLMETKEGTLRTLFWDEVKAYGFFKGYSRFMGNVFVPTYQHNIQSFVLGGAGFLVISVGLRSLGVLPTQIVYIALGVEFTLLIVWAITMYFTSEEPITENPDVLLHEHPVEDKYERLVGTMKELNRQLALLENRLQMTESKFDQLGQLDSSVQSLASKFDILAGDQFNLRVKREFEQLLTEISGRVAPQNQSQPQ
jgi:hypothetical protein